MHQRQKYTDQEKVHIETDECENSLCCLHDINPGYPSYWGLTTRLCLYRLLVSRTHTHTNQAGEIWQTLLLLLLLRRIIRRIIRPTIPLSSSSSSMLRVYICHCVVRLLMLVFCLFFCVCVWLIVGLFVVFRVQCIELASIRVNALCWFSYYYYIIDQLVIDFFLIICLVAGYFFITPLPTTCR